MFECSVCNQPINNCFCRRTNDFFIDDKPVVGKSIYEGDPGDESDHELRGLSNGSN